MADDHITLELLTEAKSGEAAFLMMLGIMYQIPGAEKYDPVKSYIWYRLAQRAGSIDVNPMINSIKTELTDQQLKFAENFLNNFELPKLSDEEAKAKEIEKNIMFLSITMGQDEKKAWAILQEAEDYYLKLNDKQRIATLHTTKSLFYENNYFHYDKAADEQLKAATLYEEMGSLHALAIANCNLARIMLKLGDHEKSKFHLNIAENYFSQSEWDYQEGDNFCTTQISEIISRLSSIHANTLSEKADILISTDKAISKNIKAYQNQEVIGLAINLYRKDSNKEGEAKAYEILHKVHSIYSGNFYLKQAEKLRRTN